jgi:hypothetical protein
MINDAVDRLYKFVTPDKTSPTLGWVAQSNFPEVIGMIGDEEITVSWLKGRILANSPLRETVCYISFSLMEYTKDVIFRELGSRYARELGLIPKDVLNRFERQVQLATLKDELFSQMLKTDSGLTMEILGNQLAFKNDIKIHLNQLN